MGALSLRVKALEDRHGAAMRQHRHVILASAGNQSDDEVWAEASRVCADMGKPITPDDGFCLILRSVFEVGKDGRAVYSDAPISINQVDGRWLR